VNLRSAFQSPEAKRRYVRGLFATIADRYDFITVLLSYGLDRRWKRRLIAEAGVRRGETVLDLACGTGDIAFEAAARGASVFGLDITPRMIVLAREKVLRIESAGVSPAPRFLVGDMCALPFPDQSVDVVTTGYGLRNVPVIEEATDEIARVLKPGGRLASLDFNRPESRVVRVVYLAYLSVVGAALGWILHGDPDTYRYIPESIRRYPGAAGVAAILRAKGFQSVQIRRVLGGLMAVHTATKTR
jgi:demethylmenaquinone methyltransferase/2-methoxy-6-polyprenyl-1,4-benzoquinol methylase